MKIVLTPQRRSDELLAEKTGDVLTVNGFQYDFSRMGNGDTLPRSAIGGNEFFTGDINKVSGEISLSLLFPNPPNYSQEQAFPAPMLDVPDGRLVLPPPLADELGAYPELTPMPEVQGPGVIDWSQLVTAAMKLAAADAAHLAAMKSELNSRNTQAITQISRVQDRIETIGYGIELGEATPEEEAEQVVLLPVLSAWKAYKFALGKVTKQPTWHAAPAWPISPPIPVIVASPEGKSPDQV